MERPPDPHDDWYYLDRIRSRDPEALIALYRKYGGRVLALALRILSDRPAAEEVVQDVFHRLWEKSLLYDMSKGEFLSWLLTMTRNIAIDSRRRETRRASFFVPIGMTEETAGRNEGSERCAEVRQILAGLPPAQKTVLEMLYFEGLTNAELAQRLGEPLGTIKTRARLALGKLRTLLQGEEKPS